MTNKIQALVYGILSGFTGWLAYFIALPPSLQTGMIGEITTILPASWQPVMAGFMKTVSVVSGIYMGYKAAHSGPQTPPKNPPNE
jgi:hypothetical protein